MVAAMFWPQSIFDNYLQKGKEERWGSVLSDAHSCKLFTSSMKSETFPISGFHCLPCFTHFLSTGKFHKHPEVSFQKNDLQNVRLANPLRPGHVFQRQMLRNTEECFFFSS